MKQLIWALPGPSRLGLGHLAFGKIVQLASGPLHGYHCVMAGYDCLEMFILNYWENITFRLTLFKKGRPCIAQLRE